MDASYQAGASGEGPQDQEFRGDLSLLSAHQGKHLHVLPYNVNFIIYEFIRKLCCGHFF